VSYSPIRLVLVVLLIGINGFFAGAEVSLLSVRHSRLRQMAAEGHAGAHAALSLLSNPGRLLSVTQVGVTLASLGLGWAGEDTVYEMLVSLLHPVITPATSQVLHGLSLLVAFITISYCHVVLGEVVPKNLAISRADYLAALCAPPLLLFYRVTLPFVVVIERSADVISRSLRGKGTVHGNVHTAEELKLIVSTSRGLGYLPEAQEDMIHRVLDLEAISVREVMVPRHDIVSVSSSATLDQVLATMIDQQHSRLPVYEGTPEKIIGLLHYKDLLPVWQERRRAILASHPSRAFSVKRIMRRHMVVPESKAVSQMLDEFQHANSHMAMVVDEFGTIVGLLTVEDVLEQIVGRIDDEYDEKVFHRETEDGETELDGATRIRDLETEYGIELPGDSGFETLAGFLLFKLGEIPDPGDSVEYDGRRYTVLEMERNRIARVRVERIAA
jgi:CBS domain containing-hemolysin-like protein